MRYQAQLKGILVDNRPVDYYSNDLERTKDWARLIVNRHGGEVQIFEAKIELIETVKAEEKKK